MSSSSSIPKPPAVSIPHDISKRVNVYDYPNQESDTSQRSSRLAYHFLAEGYRVTDHYGVDLTVEGGTATTGGRLVRGEDAYATFMDENRRKTIQNMQNPSNRPPRPPTDYESGKRHPADECGIPNCDHSVHFGGDEYGEMKWEETQPGPTAPETSRKEGDGNDGQSGGRGSTGGA